MTGQNMGDALRARATSPDGPQPPSASSRSGVPIAVAASLPFVFEPHGAFRSKLADEDWPFGYISGGPGVVEPIFALHEVIGERSAEELAGFAAFIVLACNSFDGLVSAVEKTRQLVADCAPSGFTDRDAVMALYENNAALTAALSRARGEQS